MLILALKSMHKDKQTDKVRSHEVKFLRQAYDNPTLTKLFFGGGGKGWDQRKQLPKFTHMNIHVG
jgi:hypothetical protein